MTKERFSEMLWALIAGEVIEVCSFASPDIWIQVAIDPEIGQFKLNNGEKWYPCAIGGPGARDWRRIELRRTSPDIA